MIVNCKVLILLTNSVPASHTLHSEITRSIGVALGSHPSVIQIKTTGAKDFPFLSRDNTDHDHRLYLFLLSAGGGGEGVEWRGRYLSLAMGWVEDGPSFWPILSVCSFLASLFLGPGPPSHLLPACPNASWDSPL